MKKPPEIYIFGILYLILGLIIVPAFFWLVLTDFSAFTFSSPYDAGDVEYSVEAQNFMVRYALGPIFFLGGLFAIPGSILLLLMKDKERQGYYLILSASACWSLAVIGLIVIWIFLSKRVRNQILD